MADTSRKDVIVIGGGISGLVCSYRLKSLGVDALLIERSDHPGGVIRSETVEQFLIERGPNSAQGTEEMLALVEELGIDDELVEGDPKAPAYVYFGGRLHPVPSGPGALVKSNLLSARGKLRILSEILVPARRSDGEETVASFARRRIGREAAERMVAPFVSGIYAGDFEALSVQAAFPRLANLEKSYGGLFRGMIAEAKEARRAKKAAGDILSKAAPARRRLCSFRRGMGFLPETIAARLGEGFLTGCDQVSVSTVFKGMAPNRQPDPRSGALVIEAGELEFEVSFRRAGRDERYRCKQVVIATPAKAAASLIDPLSAELGRLIGEITYPPLATLSLAYEESSIKVRLDGFGFLAAPSEGLNILGCVWNTSLFKGRAPAGKALLTVFIGGARNPGAARMGDDELVSVAHAELRQVLGITGEPRVVAITRYERAIPQYNLGHAERVRRIDALASRVPGLKIAGNYLRGVSTGDCIKEADRVAREIKANMAQGL